MPIYKFKTFEEAKRAQWCFNPDKIYYENFKKFWNISNQLRRWDYPKGIFKFKTIEEANKHQEQIIKENIRKNLENNNIN